MMIFHRNSHGDLIYLLVWSLHRRINPPKEESPSGAEDSSYKDIHKPVTYERKASKLELVKEAVKRYSLEGRRKVGLVR